MAVPGVTVKVAVSMTYQPTAFFNSQLKTVDPSFVSETVTAAFPVLPPEPAVVPGFVPVMVAVPEVELKVAVIPLTLVPPVFLDCAVKVVVTPAPLLVFDKTNVDPTPMAAENVCTVVPSLPLAKV
ncbi:hypothetical protein AQBE111736_08790 [Aquirufa beregesia]